MMVKNWKMASLLLIIGFILPKPATAESMSQPLKFNPKQLEQTYKAFHKCLNFLQVTKDYPKAIELLQSPDITERNQAFKLLSNTEDPNVIPWLLPYILQQNVYAGSALDKIITSIALKRRDQTRSDIIIKPQLPDDIDLSPVAWIIYKMLYSGNNGNMLSYAANMIGYLNLQDFDLELEKIIKTSADPAAVHSAENAIQMLKRHK